MESHSLAPIALEVAIAFHFNRLKVDIHWGSPYSGLDCDYEPNKKQRGKPSHRLFSVYDDNTSNYYDGDKLIIVLSSLHSATLEPDREDNIWNLIRSCEAGDVYDISEDQN